MATLLDLGLVQYFSAVFPFLFVAAVCYALLQKTKVIGDSPAFHALISVIVAFILLLSDNAVKLINFIIPWVAVAVVFLVLLLLIFQTMGAKEADLNKAIKDKAVYWTLIGTLIVILIAGFANVFGQSTLEAQAQVQGVSVGEPSATSFEHNIYAILFHPKILGMMVLFAIAIFAVALLSAGPD